MIDDQSISFSYYASLAAITSNIELYYDGFQVWVSGFADKQATLLQLVLEIVAGYLNVSFFFYYVDSPLLEVHLTHPRSASLDRRRN